VTNHALDRTEQSLPDDERVGRRSAGAKLAAAPTRAGIVARLAAIVGLSAAVRAVISLGAVSPWVLPDELVYSDLARSIAAGGRPAVRDVPVFGWGEVYPTLLAPVWALVDDRYIAYHASLVVNAILMSLAAVPAYFLARLFVSSRSSFIVALLTVLVPSLSYTGAVLTENAFYPAFVLALFAVARAVRTPNPQEQAFALGALALVAFARIQGVALLAAYGAAVLVYSITSNPGERIAYLRRFAPSLLVVVPVAVAPVAFSMARGEGVFGWLGQRSGTFDEFHGREVPQWFVFLGVGLVLYVAVIPAVSTVVVTVLGLTRRASEPLRLFAAVALPTVAVVLLSVALVSASFDVDGIGNLNERYVFHLVPLTFVGLALWIEQGLPRPRPWAASVLGIACVAPALLPVDRLDYNAGLQALALVPWAEIVGSPGAIAILVGACTLALGASWLVARPRTAWRLWVLVATWMVVLGMFAVESNRASASRTAAAFDGRSATWVDDALPRDAEVVMLWDETQARKDLPDSYYFWLMVTEFFNGSVGDMYRLGGSTRYEDFLPTVPATLGAGRAVLDGAGEPVVADYALVTCRTPVVGQEVARSPRGALRLVRIGGPVVVRAAPGCKRREP
jgi:hypothetical protein